MKNQDESAPILIFTQDKAKQNSEIPYTVFSSMLMKFLFFSFKGLSHSDFLRLEMGLLETPSKLCVHDKATTERKGIFF